jgi:hypothetical protein
MFHAKPVIIVVFQIDGGMRTMQVAIRVVRTKRTLQTLAVLLKMTQSQGSREGLRH